MPPVQLNVFAPLAVSITLWALHTVPVVEVIVRVGALVLTVTVITDSWLQPKVLVPVTV